MADTIRFPEVLAAWGTPAFDDAIKDAIRRVDPSRLPLQDALVHSSHLGCGEIGVMVLNKEASTSAIHVKVGVFFSGVDAGSCCADDPSPLVERSEYCEILVDIQKDTAAVTARLV
jgi:hypothetical protein